MEMNHLDKSDIDQEDVMKKDLFFYFIFIKPPALRAGFLRGV